METKIYDFRDLSLSDRNGSYGGNSGDKEGVFINGTYWLIKYPRNTRDLSNIGSLTYTSSPQSEYIGSHIYKILGYPVHETLLGIRNDQIVVACKDICDDDHRLIEFRQLKNTYNTRLSKELETSLHSTPDNHFVNLKEIMIHLRYNPELQNVAGLEERFWDCVIIDGLINNNDRNNGNWGILRSRKEKILAPVYDNGSAFSPNIPESKIRRKLSDERLLMDSAMNGVTAYSLDGQRSAMFKELAKQDILQLRQASLRVIPNILISFNNIADMITKIPEQVGRYQILTSERKQEYISEMRIRTEYILKPMLDITEQKQYNKDHQRDHFENVKTEKNVISSKNRSKSLER